MANNTTGLQSNEPLKEEIKTNVQELETLKKSNFGAKASRNFDTNYTSESDGYVLIDCGYQALANNGYFRIYLNGISVNHFFPSASNSVSFSFYVRKGMQYKVEKLEGVSATCNLYFVPFE